MTMDTEEGYHYNEETGITEGLPCEGVIVPRVSETVPETQYDAIVVGAGYAGLIAARDLTIRGHKVLLLEARDRIGGRTWTSAVKGYKYEMGGSWIHWGQPHIWTELSRYDMIDQLVDSHGTSYGLMNPTYHFSHRKDDVPSDEHARNFAIGLTTFCDVDGKLGRTVLPSPHKPFTVAETYGKWDRVSAAERFEQISAQLTPDQRDVLLSSIVMAAGAPATDVAFTEILHWWALAGYDAHAYMQLFRWKLKCGQTGLSLRIFQDALSSGNLSYRFSTPATRIDQSQGGVTVTVQAGTHYTGRYLVCTVPLNTLNDIGFSPPLARSKVLAASKGQVNLSVKVHAEVAGEEYRSWVGVGYPGPMVGIFGDGITPSGNTHLVSFSVRDAFEGPNHGFPEVKAACQEFRPLTIKRLLYHPWATDPYAKGSWAMFAPGFVSQFKSDLQAPQGRVYFASADWADGWHGFIDGAIEQGMRASMHVDAQLRNTPPARA